MADENAGGEDQNKPELDELSPEAGGELDEQVDKVQEINGDMSELDLILDIPVTISMEIGQTNISIRELLRLNKGSVVELDRVAGDPLDVKVNGTLVARGEVVVVNDKFGLRLTEVISTADRIAQLTREGEASNE